MSLPIFQIPVKEVSMMQTSWAAILNPIITNPSTNPTIIKNIVLASGDNVINHLLGRVLQGWHPIRFHGGWAQIYDKQDTNTMQNLTLILNAGAGVTVDLLVF